MPYIDKDYYENDYKGMPITDNSIFDRYVRRASETIDSVTNYKLNSVGFESLAPFIQEQVKKATAAQIEYLLVSGQGAAMGAGGFGQVSVGNFSYGDKPGATSENRYEKMTSGAVLSYLEPTGLLYQGVGVCD